MADWRIRPLPQDMIKYAREDTHYLIYIYERMKQDLNLHHCLGNTEKGTPNKESKDSMKSQSESSQIAPVKEEGVNLVLQVWNNSRSVCMNRYRIPCYEEKYLKFCRKLTEKGNTFNNQQSYALQELFFWRDRVAREEDEGPHFVMPKDMMIKVVNHLPNEPEGILHCCSDSLFVQKHLQHLHKIMLKARALTISTEETTKKNSNGSTATASSPITTTSGEGAQ
jgi:exosome complex exonuclease RRP6